MPISDGQSRGTPPRGLPTSNRRGALGRALTSLAGGALAFNLIMVLGLLLLLLWQGGAYFWPRDLAWFELADGRQVLGEIHEHRELRTTAASGAEPIYEVRLKTGNREPELGGQDFVWIREADIKRSERPHDAVLLERRSWGPFFGYPVAIRRGDGVIAEGRDGTFRKLEQLVPEKAEHFEKIRKLEKGEIGDVNYEIERLRLSRRKLSMSTDSSPDKARADAELQRATQVQESRFGALADRLRDERQSLEAEILVIESIDGRRKTMPVSEVVRAVRPNELSTAGKIGLYASRLWEFVSDEPRESNTEGGIFPAIFGTVLMVLLMSVIVVPLGVLAALYLREYAKQGPLVRAVRIAVNNLAGTPSIVFGVFGLGFFVYFLGGSIDRWFYSEHTSPVFGTGGILWASLTLALLTVPVVIVAAEEGLAAVPRAVREGSLALGATKWETLRKVVIPASSPAILTGMILAMGRAAGEVAPLMIVGMVKLAPDLPISLEWPFLHFERKFMHIGFHIYDVGFQSPNVEATKPLVSATALLLIVVVTILNLAAIRVRNRLRAKYATTGL